MRKLNPDLPIYRCPQCNKVLFQGDPLYVEVLCKCGKLAKFDIKRFVDRVSKVLQSNTI